MQNSKGKVFFGMHFYPGVAEYQDPGKDPYRVFLNEDTIRAMDPTFAGCPVFVMHVDDIEPNLDELRKEVDGWVVRSFYNQADGKHWAEFMVVSERGLRAVAQGMQLSNAYVLKGAGQGGLWNGVSYIKEVTAAAYEHLAIVPNPRYEESIILTPEDFKKYNEAKNVELKRLQNADKENKPVKFNMFKRDKVQNSADLELMSVELPKSKREMTITQLVTEADEREVQAKLPRVANATDLVANMGDGKMTVGDIVAKHQSMCDELEAYKKAGVKNDDDDNMENADDDDEEETKKKKEAETKENGSLVGNPQDNATKNDLDAARVAAEKKAKAKDAADKLRNAKPSMPEAAKIEVSFDKVERGRQLFGS